MYIFEPIDCRPAEAKVICELKKKRKDCKKGKGMWWAVLYGQFINWREKSNA